MPVPNRALTLPVRTPRDLIHPDPRAKMPACIVSGTYEMEIEDINSAQDQNIEMIAVRIWLLLDAIFSLIFKYLFVTPKHIADLFEAIMTM